MFKINNLVNLSLKQLMILLVIVFCLFALYNIAFISRNYYPMSKYKNTLRKFKNIQDKYQNKIDELTQINNTQSLMIDQLSFKTSKHSRPLSTDDNLIKQLASENTKVNVSSDIPITKQELPQSNEQLMTSIDTLLNNNSQRQNEINSSQNDNSYMNYNMDQNYSMNNKQYMDYSFS